MTTSAPDGDRSRVLLIAGWFLTAGVVGPIGFLVSALSERPSDRLVGSP